MGTAYRQLGLVALAEGNLSTAQSLLQKSLELFTGFVTGWDIVRTLTYLGETATASGDLGEARRIYLQALELAQEVQAVPLALDALVGLAYHYTQAGDPERVLRLCNYVLAHAASIQETKARARCLAEQAESRLTLEQVQSATNWGVGKSLEAIIETLP
jgi:tetratricopeptide (TPR) repeat protein